MVKRKIADVESPDAVPTTTSPRKKVVASDFLPVDPAILPDDARLDLADAEIYYIADFIDAKIAKRWYEELVQLDTCTYAAFQLEPFALTDNHSVRLQGISLPCACMDVAFYSRVRCVSFLPSLLERIWLTGRL